MNITCLFEIFRCNVLFRIYVFATLKVFLIWRQFHILSFNHFFFVFLFWRKIVVVIQNFRPISNAFLFLSPIDFILNFFLYFVYSVFFSISLKLINTFILINILKIRQLRYWLFWLIEYDMWLFFLNCFRNFLKWRAFIQVFIVFCNIEIPILVLSSTGNFLYRSLLFVCFPWLFNWFLEFLASISWN